MSGIMEIPSGYMVDHKGNLVNKKNVKAIDLNRDALVKKLWKKANRLHEELQAFRRESLDAISALVVESAQEHGVVIGGKKGNVVITSFDGSMRVHRTIAERISFTEELEVARSLVHECLQEFSKGANKNLKALVEGAFEIDNKGNVSVTKILGLRRVKIEHEKWRKAMSIIADSIAVVSSKEYVRFYVRKEDGEYEHVNMNFAG